MITATEFEERLALLCGNLRGAGFPRKQRDRQILLRSVVQSLDPTLLYSESQLNAALQQWLIGLATGLDLDHVTLRRYLVDAGFLQRDASGTSYEIHLEGRGETIFDAAIAALDPYAIVLAAREEAAARKLRHQTSPPIDP